MCCLGRTAETVAETESAKRGPNMKFASKKMEQFVKLSPNQYISMVIALGQIRTHLWNLKCEQKGLHAT